MNKTTLTRDQLQQLMTFIESRGFKEPFVVMEILDHFACKVEEKLENNPSLSLEDAMHEAHADFGALGFSPISSTYYAYLKKKYKSIYNSERKKVFTSFLYMPLLAVVGIIIYKAFAWCEINNYRHLFGINDVANSCFLLFFVSSAYLRTYSQDFPKKIDPIKSTILAVDVTLPIGLVFITPHFNKLSERGIAIMGTLYALIFVYLCIRHISLYKTLKIAKNEIKETNNNYNNLVA